MKQIHKEDENKSQLQSQNNKEERDITRNQGFKERNNTPMRTNGTLFPHKGYQGEKVITPEKITTTNQFHSLTEETEDQMQNHNNVVTVDVNHNGAINLGDRSKGISTKDWVTKSFHHQETIAFSVNNKLEISAIKERKNLEQNQMNDAKKET